MTPLPRGVSTPRRLVLTAGVAIATTAVVVSLGPRGTATEEDASAFTVAGDGSVPTEPPRLGDARDPLSTDETGYAIHLAAADRSIPADATNVRSEDGPEFLSAGVPDVDVDATGRFAVVTLYDYSHEKTYQQLVDLRGRRVTTSQSTVGLQPPTSSDEADAAIELALSARHPPSFVAQFEQLEGVPLVSATQVHYAAGTWVFDGSTAGGAACGRHRCARLVVSTSSGVFLDTNDTVVDLSAGTLVELDTP